MVQSNSDSSQPSFLTLTIYNFPNGFILKVYEFTPANSEAFAEDIAYQALAFEERQ